MAAGEKVPMVFFPRFSSFVGDGSYYTTPIDMLGFGQFSVSGWRGKLLGTTSPTFGFLLQESADLESWENLDGVAWDPLEDGTDTKTHTPTRRYVRMAVVLATSGGSDAQATCWAVGFAERTTQ